MSQAAAAKLVEAVEQVGGHLVSEGGRLKVSAPKPLPASLLDDLRHNKAALISYLNVPNAAAPTRSQTGQNWDPETAALIEWFLNTEPPAGPFELQQAVYIAHPDRYWEYLRQDIAAGPNRARGRTGAFQENLRRLYRIFHDGKDIGFAK